MRIFFPYHRYKLDFKNCFLFVYYLYWYHNLHFQENQCLHLQLFSTSKHFLGAFQLVKCSLFFLGSSLYCSKLARLSNLDLINFQILIDYWSRFVKSFSKVFGFILYPINSKESFRNNWIVSTFYKCKDEVFFSGNFFDLDLAPAFPHFQLFDFYDGWL